MSHSQRVCFFKKNHKQYFVVKTAVNRGLSYGLRTPAKKEHRHMGDTTSCQGSTESRLAPR